MKIYLDKLRVMYYSGIMVVW